MNNVNFGEMIFNTGWKSDVEIIMFETLIKITVKAKAYYEEDGITKEQEISFYHFNNNKEELLKRTEELIYKYTETNSTKRFIPKTLLFERNGTYALLLDDIENLDSGIAITLFPEMKLLFQDDYL